MIDRRDLLIAAGCGAALASATWLTPRRTLTLMPEGAKLDALVPKQMAGWVMSPGGDIVIPETPDSLASRLYSDQLARAFRREGANEDVMLLIAYGKAQSDLLQLHRPEVCYPAIGFEITQRRLVQLPIAAGVTVPAVMLTAETPARTEDIIYWTRLGEALPQTGGEQSRDRLLAAMEGYVGDGALVRASALRTGDGDNFDELRGFMTDLIRAIPLAGRRALIGTARANAVA